MSSFYFSTQAVEGFVGRGMLSSTSILCRERVQCVARLRICQSFSFIHVVFADIVIIFYLEKLLIFKNSPPSSTRNTCINATNKCMNYYMCNHGFKNKHYVQHKVKSMLTSCQCSKNLLSQRNITNKVTAHVKVLNL